MKDMIKKNYKFFLVLILIVVLFSIKFPYYIDTPGGIDDVSKKIDIDGYKSIGSFNLTYVREYRATIPTLLISLFNKDWDVFKEDEVLLNTEDYETYSMRDKILMYESISNAIYVAYKKANKPIEITNSNLYVTYITNESDTNLKVGDIVKSINGIEISNLDDVLNIINNYNIGSKLNIKVLNKNNTYDRYAYIVNIDNSKKIGILFSTVNEYETDPDINIKIDKNESGSSAGLVTALSIYNSLVSNDITNGLKIVVTGTIDLDGNVGSIGGVEYKLKSAVKNKADLFIVPNDNNYKEAIKYKNENKYDINIIGVNTFDEVLDYLKNV